MTAVSTQTDCHCRLVGPIPSPDEKEQEVLLRSVLRVYCPAAFLGGFGAVMWLWYAEEHFPAPQLWHAVTSPAC